MILIYYLFPMLRTAKDVVKQIFKRSFFRRPNNTQHHKWCHTLLKSARQHLCNIYWSLWRKLSCKRSVLVICKFLGLVANTLTADHKYSLIDRDILTQPIHIQLSKKQKTFCYLSSVFLKSSFNFECFARKYHPHTLSISDITDCERRGYTNV